MNLEDRMIESSGISQSKNYFPIMSKVQNADRSETSAGRGFHIRHAN